MAAAQVCTSNPWPKGSLPGAWAPSSGPTQSQLRIRSRLSTQGSATSSSESPARRWWLSREGRRPPVQPRSCRHAQTRDVLRCSDGLRTLFSLSLSSLSPFALPAHFLSFELPTGFPLPFPSLLDTPYFRERLCPRRRRRCSSGSAVARSNSRPGLVGQDSRRASLEVVQAWGQRTGPPHTHTPSLTLSLTVTLRRCHSLVLLPLCPACCSTPCAHVLSVACSCASSAPP